MVLWFCRFFGNQIAKLESNTKTMKSIKHILTLIILGATFLTSCKKDLVEKYDQSKNVAKVVAKNTNEVKAPENFSWNTNRIITITSTPIINDVRVAVLKVTSTEGVVLFTQLHKVKDPINLKLEIPSIYEKVNVVFCGIQKTYDTKGGKVDLILQ